MDRLNEMTENELLLELEHILVNHRYNCSRFENIYHSNSTYIYRIKKALRKTKSEEKRKEVLRIIINSVNSKINRGMLFKEIFEPLPTIIESELKKTSNKKATSEKPKEEKTAEEREKEIFEGKTKWLSDMVDQILEKLNGYTRKDLLDLENTYNYFIGVETANYGIKNAKAEIIGSLNIGMIECTKKNLEKALYEQCNIKANKSHKLSDKMSTELLKYRLAGLIYTDTMCRQRIVKIRPKVDSYINIRAYNGLKEDVRFLGEVIKEKYQDKYGISPKDEIIKNHINGQLTFPGLMEKRDEIIRKYK